MSGASQLTVSALNRYPVKSMLGEALQECEVGLTGLVGDRAYAVIDEATGKVASAKNPRKWGGLLGFRASFADQPGLGQPVPPVLITGSDGTAMRSDDHDVHVRLSKMLGRPVRLAAIAAEASCFEEVWPDIEGLAPRDFIEQTTVDRQDTGEVVSDISLGLAAPPGTFFDLAVLHLLTTATLRQLRQSAPDAIFDVRRYRPNVLVAAQDRGFVENEWVGKTVRVGDDLRVAVTLPTMRCVMTTLPQEDLPADRRTLQAIAAQNRVEIPGFGTWACAGVYGNVAAPGNVRVGDAIGVD
jgi:uncharacterized protein YcbX